MIKYWSRIVSSSIRNKKIWTWSNQDFSSNRKDRPARPFSNRPLSGSSINLLSSSFEYMKIHSKSFGVQHLDCSLWTVHFDPWKFTLDLTSDMHATRRFRYLGYTWGREGSMKVKLTKTQFLIWFELEFSIIKIILASEDASACNLSARKNYSFDPDTDRKMTAWFKIVDGNFFPDMSSGSKCT